MAPDPNTGTGYPVTDEIVDRFVSAFDNENDNPLFILNRQQGQATAIKRFIERLDRDGRDAKIGVYSTSLDRAKDVVSHVKLTSGTVSVVALPRRPPTDHFDLVIISEAHYVEKDKLAAVTGSYPYVAITTMGSEHRGTLLELSETIDRRWYVDGKVIEENVPPWLDVEKMRKRFDEIRERCAAFYVNLGL